VLHTDDVCIAELSVLLTKVNQALPDELASITSSSQLTQPPASASQNGSDLRAAETILKNRNLSNLLNSECVPRAAPMAVGGRYPNMRHQMMTQQRQFAPNSGLRVGMVQPAGAQMPMYMQIPGTPMHPARGPVVGYPSRHPADVMRAGGAAFDGAGRRFVNPGSSYFMNGPDMRSAMMNGAPFQRPQAGAYPPGATPVTTFPPGQGQFGMSGYSPSGNPGHGSSAANVFTGMAVPSEAGQSFSPGLAMSIPNSFISSGTFPVSSTTNSGPVVCSRNAISVSSPAPVVSVMSTQLLNGSYVPSSSSLGHKPLTDVDAAAKSSGLVSGPSSLPASTLNCQRFSMTLPEVTVSSRQTGSRQLPAPEKDGNIFALETSLVSC